MSFTEDYHRTNALRALVEMMLIHIIRNSANPQNTASEFRNYIADYEETLMQFGVKALMDGKEQVYANATEAGCAFTEISKGILAAVDELKL